MFGVWAGLLCGAGVLGVGLLAYGCGWMGGGDAKLLVALAMWLGPADLSIAFLGIACVGVGLLLVGHLAPGSDFRRRGIPFACAIAPPSAAVLAARIVGL